MHIHKFEKLLSAMSLSESFSGVKLSPTSSCSLPVLTDVFKSTVAVGVPAISVVCGPVVIVLL